MVKRKLYAFLLTIVFAMPLVGVSFMLIERSSFSEVPGLILFASMFAIPVMLVFGVPVSLLSDKLNNHLLGKIRKVSALLVHVVGAILFVTLFLLVTESRFIFTEFNGFDLYFIAAAVIISFTGWGMDEVLRCLSEKRSAAEPSVRKE